MNYKPGSVETYPFGSFIAAICLKEPFPSLFSSLPAFDRRAAGVTLRLYYAYLTLLLMRLAIPATSPPPRWALTPPFHPYPTTKNAKKVKTKTCIPKHF